MIDQLRRQLAPFFRLAIKPAAQILNRLLALGEQPFRRLQPRREHRCCVRCLGRCIALHSSGCGNVACNIHGYAIGIDADNLRGIDQIAAR